MAASIAAGGGAESGGSYFIDSSQLDLRRYARRHALAMALVDYIIYVERDPRKVSGGGALMRRGLLPS